VDSQNQPLTVDLSTDASSGITIGAASGNTFPVTYDGSAISSPTFTAKATGAKNVTDGTAVLTIVSSGTPTPSPTPTDTPTASPSPTASPAGNAIANGDFETGDLTSWYPCYAPHPSLTAPIDPNPAATPATQSATTLAQTVETDGAMATIQTSVPSGSVLGTYSAIVGHSDTQARKKGLQGICQDVTVPASNPTLTFSVYEGGNVNTFYTEDAEADVFAGATWSDSTATGAETGAKDTTSNPAVTMFAETNCYNNLNVSGGSSSSGPCATPAPAQPPTTPGGQWRQKGPYDLSAYAGQTITLMLGQWSSSTSSGYYNYVYFDNVVLSGS